MTRRAPLQTLARSVLVAALTCTVLPATVLAGQGHGRNQDDDGGHGRSDERRQNSDDSHGNGRGQSGNSGHGRSEQQRQNSDDYYGNGKHARQSQSLSPQDAAQQARSQYGGEVLKVQPAGDGYQVRLLQDDGRVVTVPIED